MRKRIAIYIDHVLRIPNFISSYEAFKNELFSVDIQEVEVVKDGLDIQSYWKSQMDIDEIGLFYSKTTLPKEDIEVRDMISYFYSQEHLTKFLDDYSFNLYTDGVLPNTQDVDIINITQKELFDVVLIDEYVSRRKKGNTFFYLSKIRVYPYSVLFLNETDSIVIEDYVGIWNPLVNPDQVNAKDDKTFLNWMLKLESENKTVDSE